MFLKGAPRGIQRGRHDPLRAGEELAQGRTVELFIFTRFLKGFGELIRFRCDGIDQVSILNIDAASGIPKAPPQKHKDFHCF